MLRFWEAVEKYKEKGGNFFEEGTMEFWGTELVPTMYPFNVFFTWDDNFDRTQKLVSVRRFVHNFGEIETISFQQHSSIEDAMEYYEDWVKEILQVY